MKGGRDNSFSQYLVMNDQENISMPELETENLPFNIKSLSLQTQIKRFGFVLWQRTTPKIQKYSEVQTSPGPLQQPGSFGRLRPTANGWTGVSVQLRQPGSQGVRQASENQRPPPAPAGPDYLTAEQSQSSSASVSQICL